MGKLGEFMMKFKYYYYYYPEQSFHLRITKHYNFLYQSLIPNCELTIKILKPHLNIPSDVESFVINGENPRIRCQRIINLLLVQLDTTRNYKHFCYLFTMISVITDLPSEQRTGNYQHKLLLRVATGKSCYTLWKISLLHSIMVVFWELVIH